MKKTIDKRRKVCYNRGTKTREDRRAERLKKVNSMKRYGITEALKEIANGADIFYYDKSAKWVLNKYGHDIGLLSYVTAFNTLRAMGEYNRIPCKGYTIYQSRIG